MKEFTIYTDGSCINNPGPGGWAAIIIDNATGEREEISGGNANTTNNRMELFAVISALRKISAGDTAEIFTDSTYVQNGLTKWMENWKKTGWMTTSRKPVLNQDMWQELDKLVSERNINFKWVRGHNGNTFNEWCDRLAFSAAQKSQKLGIDKEDYPLGSTDTIIEGKGELPTAKLKIARKLQLKKYRSELKMFVAEGLRLCEMALQSADIQYGFYTEEFLKTDRADKLVADLSKVTTMYKIPPETFDRIRDTQTPQGIMVIANQKLSTPKAVAQKNFVVVLDGVQDPGNVGTILRTAEAFDCGVILLEGAVDIFNPKVVRATMGAIFDLTVTEMTSDAFLKLMKSSKFEVTAAALDGKAEIYFNHDFTKKSAVVFGNEAGGVSEKIFKSAKKIFIPMTGKAESLNVATAAAIIVAEAARQKN